MRGRQVPLIDQIDFVSGVSGGAVPAAYFGLKRRAALEDFRERFLIRNAEEELNTAVSLGNISRAVAGGVNEDTRFRAWLDANLFEGATFSALLTERRPRIWINATDIYNGTPFVFGKTAFSAICSDLANYPIASAVAASAAVPVVFCADRARGLSGPLQSAAPRVDREGARRPERAAAAARVRAGHRALSRRNRDATSSCSTAGWSTISGFRDSPSGGSPPRCPMDR